MPTGSFRGGIQVGNTLYAGYTGELYSVNQSGEITLYSTLGGSDNLFLGRNNRSPVADVAVVCNSNTALLISSTASAVIAYPDGDVGSPTAVWDHMGFFMFGYGDGTIQSSDVNSTNLNTLKVARTETNPDGVMNGFSWGGNMYVLGEKSIEVWGDPRNNTGFPLTRIGYNIVPGLKAPHAVRGWEPEFGYAPIWVGSDNTVRQLNGFQAVQISPPDLDRLIAAVVFPETDLEALVYNVGGNAFWQLNCETGTSSTSWSWVYELSTKTWHERRSQGQPNSNFKRSAPAFGKWLVGDRNSDDLLAVNHTHYEEAGAEISAIMESGPAKDFPNRQRIKRVDFDFTPGTGIASSTIGNVQEPTVLIEASKDGGRTWPVSWVRALGRQGDHDRRIFVLNAGLSNDEGVRWRWTISDPVHIGFQGADMVVELETK